MLFQIPKEQKEFWGAEYLTPKGLLSVTSAVMRIETYARVNGLLCEDPAYFKLDETLKTIFKTTSGREGFASMADLLSQLSN
jgi:hypothetical protein